MTFKVVHQPSFGQFPFLNRRGRCGNEAISVGKEGMNNIKERKRNMRCEMVWNGIRLCVVRRKGNISKNDRRVTLQNKRENNTIFHSHIFRLLFFWSRMHAYKYPFSFFPSFFLTLTHINLSFTQSFTYTHTHSFSFHRSFLSSFSLIIFSHHFLSSFSLIASLISFRPPILCLVCCECSDGLGVVGEGGPTPPAPEVPQPGDVMVWWCDWEMEWWCDGVMVWWCDGERETETERQRQRDEWIDVCR